MARQMFIPTENKLVIFIVVDIRVLGVVAELLKMESSRTRERRRVGGVAGDGGTKVGGKVEYGGSDGEKKLTGANAEDLNG